MFWNRLHRKTPCRIRVCVGTIDCIRYKMNVFCICEFVQERVSHERRSVRSFMKYRDFAVRFLSSGVLVLVLLV